MQTTVRTPRRTFDCRFSLGDTVYLVIREEKIAGMITGINVRPAGTVYQVCWSNTGCDNIYYEMELTDEFCPDYLQEI